MPFILPILGVCMRCNMLLIIIVLSFTSGLCVASERYLTVYGGKYSDDNLGELLANEAIKFENSTFAALAVGKRISEPLPSYQWEVEGQVGKHFREQSHWEFNIAAIVRWKRFPWNDFLRTSVAIGDGLSYATEVPPLELKSHTNTGATRLLNYLVIEMTVSPPQVKHWSIVGRIHHRSGIFGLFNNVSGGSNVLVLGIKFAY